MAFCTGCGAQIDDTAKFCTNCGTRVPDNAVAPSAKPSASSPTSAPEGAGAMAAPNGGGGAAKIIVVVLAIIVGFGVLAAGGFFWAGYKLKRAIRVQQSGEHASVSGPWGHVASNEDPAKLAKEIGVDVYPGAKPLPGASTVNFGGGGVASVQFASDDSVDKVGKFYAARFPNSTINTADENQQTIIATTSEGMVTIVLQKQGNGTKIAISRIGGKQTGTGNRLTE